VTVTPGKIAFDSSVTVPMISPVVHCARAGMAIVISRSSHKPRAKTPRRMLCLHEIGPGSPSDQIINSVGNDKEQSPYLDKG